MMKRIVAIVVLCLIMSAPIVAAETETLRVGTIKGPTAMGMVQLMEEGAGVFEIAANIDEILPKIVRDELDIAALPPNIASVLYNNAEGKVRVLAVHTLGSFAVLETGEAVQTVADLRGKTLYMSGKGSAPEYALRYVLAGNGIDPDADLTIAWKAEHTECVAALAMQEDAIALLPQPFATVAMMQNENIRSALDLSAEWDALQADAEKPSALITGVLVARAEFIEQSPEAVQAFLDSYASSVEYVNANVADAAALIGKYGILEGAVAEKALPYCNITFIEGEEMREKLSGYLDTLFAQNPDAVGGRVPDDVFYYIR